MKRLPLVYHAPMIRNNYALMFFALTAACSSNPGASIPAPAQTVPAAVAPVDTIKRSGYTAADVQFMQGMIGHHAQALIMTELVPARSNRQDLRMLAERIRISQRDEITMMQRWLQKRNELVPAADAHVHAALGHGLLMPGMLTEAELAQLRSASGIAFEKLFLQFMIKHHEGAIRMVQQLFAAPASGQEPELFIFASDVDADQNAEITRMRALLGRL